MFRSHELAKLIPFTLSVVGKPRDLSREAAISRHEELMKVLPERIAYIEGVLAKGGVKDHGDALGYMHSVGEWLFPKVRTEDIRRFLPLAERGRERQMDIDIATVSACNYLGYLFASRLVGSCEQLSFELCTDSKRNAYYHETIIQMPVEGSQLEPVSILMNFARMASEKDRSQRSLGDLFRIWLEKARTADSQ